MALTVVPDDNLPPMPTAYFECFAQTQFALVGGIINNTYWPTACWEAQGFSGGTLFIDLTYIYNWQQMFPAAASNPAYADQYLVLGWDQHCATCINPPGQEFSQTYPYKKSFPGSSISGLLKSTGTCSHCFLGLIFQPTGLGERPGTLKIHDNAKGSPQIVRLSGIGKSPGLVVSPAEIAFGKVQVGTPSATHNVTLTNHSPVPIALNGPTPPGGEFAITSSCGAMLVNTPGSNTCTISVTFTPAVKREVTGFLEINDDAAHNPQKVKLTGSGK